LGKHSVLIPAKVPSQNKTPTRTRALSAVTLSFLLLCIVLAVGAVTRIVVHRLDADHAQGHAIIQTKLDLDSISSATISMALFSPSLNARLRATNLDARSLYQILSSSNSGVRFLDSKREWERAGELLDAWGRPLRVAVTLPIENTNRSGWSGAVRFRIWSVGPDGKDEGGNGDDICNSFDIMPEASVSPHH
jgi:hypothetical protein